VLFRYEAMSLDGKPVRGTEEAGSPLEARASLRDRGMFAYQLEAAIPEGKRGGKVAKRSVSWLNLSGRRLDLLTQATRHLALLLRTGLPLAQGLLVLSEQIEDARFSEVLADISSRVKEGHSFDAALGAHPGYFPELYVHVAKAGIQAGELPRVLVELAAYYVRQKKLRERVVSALTYPALMCLVGLLVLVFLLTFVVPKVTNILLEQKRALPWPTEVLLAVSGAVTEGWWIALPGGLIFLYIIGKLLSTPLGRRLRDRVALRIPVLGELFRKQAVARWAGTMSTLLASGIPVSQSLAVVRGAVGNSALADDVGRLEREVEEGSSLSEALKRSLVLPRSVGFVAGVGEESGELDLVLREVAESYNEEVEVVSGRLTDVLNPVLIVFLGLVVGFIVAAILLPITDFSKIR
jgi:general secretion pathway protein F